MFSSLLPKKIPEVIYACKFIYIYNLQRGLRTVGSDNEFNPWTRLVTCKFLSGTDCVSWASVGYHPHSSCMPVCVSYLTAVSYAVQRCEKLAWEPWVECRGTAHETLHQALHHNPHSSSDPLAAQVAATPCNETTSRSRDHSLLVDHVEEMKPPLWTAATIWAYCSSPR
jgi:hypothetical protein